MRLLGIRRLPDDMDITAPSDTRRPPHDPPQALDPARNEPGKFVNIEAEFAYRRLPPPASSGANAHFIVHLGMGVVGPVHLFFAFV
jgi:hypothetical protein